MGSQPFDDPFSQDKLQELLKGGMKLPDMALIEFPNIDGRWEACELPSGNAGIRFVFWMPMLPFIRFSIPFSPTALRRFHEKIGNSLDELEAGDA